MIVPVIGRPNSGPATKVLEITDFSPRESREPPGCVMSRLSASGPRRASLLRRRLRPRENAATLLRGTRACLALLAALAVLALAVPEQAEAQTDTTFISNSAQLSSFASSHIRATAFTTGSNSGGYGISSVDVYLGPLGTATPLVEIYENNAGNPGTLFATLSNPATVTGSSANTFTATNTTLLATTTYWLATSNSAATNGAGFSVSTRANNTADTGAAMGWSIGDGKIKQVNTETTWTSTNSRTIFTIKGPAPVTNNPAMGAPTITGTAQVGQTLTAVTTGITDADGLTSPTYTYQWIRVDGGTEADIASANSSTYDLVAADQGKTIKVKVSFTDDASHAETLTSAATATVTAAPTAPTVDNVDVTSSPASGDTYGTGEMIKFTVTFDQAVTVTGTPEFEFCLGSSATVSCSVGMPPPALRRAALSSGSGTTALVFSYTVLVGDVDENGIYAGNQTIKLDGGDTIQGTVGGLTAVLTHDAVGSPTGHKVNGTPANNAPTVANPIDDQTATVGTALLYAFPTNTFADTDAGDTLTYTATQSDNSALPAWLSFAAATRTFSGTPQTADVGTVSVKVTASDGTDSVSDTFDIVVSAAANNAAMGAPTITGTAQVGQTLTAVTTGITDADGLTSPTYTYQWIRVDGGTEADIASANSSTYDLVAADQGKTIKVKVSFTDDASHAETLTSAATATVTAAPTAPMVTDVDVTSMPASGDTYGTSERIQYTVTFDQAVTVTGTPEFEFCLGSSATVSCSVGMPPPALRSAALLSGSGTTALVFSYTVLVGDVDENGIYAGNQTIKLDGGDTIQGTVGGLTAVLTHDAVGSPTGHKVNGAAANTAPTVANPIDDQTATAGTALNFAFPTNTFADTDAGDTLTYTATKSDDSALPSWLSFAAATRTFSGTPMAADVETVSVKVTANDGNGGSVSDTFDIVVSATTLVSGTTLVSNVGQLNTSTVASGRDRAQAFTTGGADATLSSVEIISADNEGDDVAVSVCTVNSSGHPTSSCTALTAPSSFAAGTLVFTDPASTTLTANTTYTLLIRTPGGDNLVLASTSDDAEDSGGAAGWTIADAYHFKNSSNAWATTGTANAMRITIKGTLGTTTPNAAPTVAYAIQNQTATVGTALNYAFPANTFADADSDTLTYTATQSDDSALPAWLSFTPGTRTFSGTPQAADVETLSVKVTASDGNGGSVSDTFDIVVSLPADTTAPRVTSIVRQTPTSSPTNANSLTWRVTFSEAVSNVDTADFAVSGTTATLSVSAVSGVTGAYDVTASGGNLAGVTATVTLSIAAGHNIQDAATNALTNTTPTGANDDTWMVDNTAPTVTITGVPTTSNAAFTATFTFSEDVTGFVAGDITVGNGTASAFTATTADRVYTASITPTANGAVTVDVAADAATDGAGNGNPAATQATSTYTAPLVDTTAPRVASIVRQTPTSSPTNADSLTWRVAFTENVKNVDAADFAIGGTTATVTAVTEVTASTVYDVTASGGNLASLDATVTLSIVSGQNIADTSDNVLSNTAPTGTNDNSYVVDNTAPTVAITGVPGTSSAAFTATFTFSEAVTGFVVGDITLGNATASNFTVTSTTVYTALITPAANGEVTVDVAADAATDAAGNGNTAATQATSNYTGPLVDTIAPRVASIVRQTPSSSPTNANSLKWRITFTENVKNVNAADFAIGGTTATVTAVTEVTASTVYDVTASGGNLAGLDATVTLSIVSGQNIADTSDNALSNPVPTGTNDNSYVVDNTAPTVAITGVPGTSSAAFTATFTFSEEVTGFVAGDITVGNGTASAFRTTTAGRVYTASITPAVSGTVTVDVAGSAARDAAGNGNPAATRASSTYTAPIVVTAPGEPASLTARAGDGEVTLIWTPPALDGGAPIERYQYRHSAGSTVASGAPWMDVPDADSDGSFADERSVTVPDLYNARQYAFEVRAVNQAVNGRAARAVATPVRAPLPPGSGFLVSNFGQTVDGAAQIYVRHNVVGAFTTGARGAELHNIEFRLFSRLPDIAQLPSATLYRASVTDTRAATRGEPVAALTAVPGSPRPAARAETVAFTAPAGTRLEAGATYLVVLEEHSFVRVESTTYPAEDAGGARGWAVDGIGAGNSSPWSYGTTGSLLMRVNGTPAGATVATAPDAPASLGASAGDARVRLRWAPPRSDGGAAVEKYQYRYSAGSRVGPGTAWIDVPDADSDGSLADERSVTVEDLDNGRQYAFALRAVNGVRAGAAATATAAPAAPRRRGFLVSNFGRPADGVAQIIPLRDIVGVFTTGTRGATLGSIDFRLFSTIPGAAPLPSATLYRGSVTDTRARRGARVASLTAAPGSPGLTATAQTVAFTAPGGTRLEAGATYLVVLSRSAYVRVASTNSSAQDAGGASGWTIDGVGAGNSSPWSYGTSGSLLMSVNGTTATAARQAVRKGAAQEKPLAAKQEEATTPNPDRGISLSTSSASAIEGQTVTIGARRAGPTDRRTSVTVQVLDSALGGAWPMDLDFRSGAATATAAVSIPFDGARPASRTVTVRLASVGEPYSVGSPSSLTFNVIDRDAAVSVHDARVSEGPGATLAFAVTLDRTRDRKVLVKYATADGTAKQGEDYTHVFGTLRFAPGETSKTVSVPVLDDAHDEGTETLVLRLSAAHRAAIEDGEATGSIENSDPMPRAWMVRFGRTVGGQVVDALTERLEGGKRSHLTVAGIPLMGTPAPEPEPEAEAEADDPFALPAWAGNDVREEGARTLTADDLLLRSTFHLRSGGEGRVFTTWGRAVTGRFAADADDVRLDGDVVTGMVGFDAEWKRSLAGVMLSRSTGEGSRLDPVAGVGEHGPADGDSGSIESDLTGVYPYARADLTDRVSAWGLVGAGTGTITLKRERGRDMKTDISMRMGALGLKGQVLDGSGPSGVAMSVKSDAMWVGTKSARSNDMVKTQGDVTRLRLIARGERDFAIREQGRLTPSAELGLRHDGGDAETGVGVELGAGLRYMAGRFTIEAQARTLVAHEAEGYEEWGVSGAVRLAPGASGRGLSLSVAPTWGRTGSASEQLWSAQDTGELEGGGGFEADGRIEAQVGYGFALPRNRGLLTPYGALTLGSEGGRTIRAGVRWMFHSDLAVTLDATRSESRAADATNELRIRAALRF